MCRQYEAVYNGTFRHACVIVLPYVYVLPFSFYMIHTIKVQLIKMNCMTLEFSGDDPISSSGAICKYECLSFERVNYPSLCRLLLGASRSYCFTQ